MNATHLHHFLGFNFWRFDLAIECGMPQRAIEYWVQYSTDHTFTFIKRCGMNQWMTTKMRIRSLSWSLVHSSCEPLWHHVRLV